MATKYLDLTFTESVRRAQNEYYGHTVKITGAPERDPLGEGEPSSLQLVTASTWARSAKAGGRTFSIAEVPLDFCGS